MRRIAASLRVCTAAAWLGCGEAGVPGDGFASDSIADAGADPDVVPEPRVVRVVTETPFTCSDDAAADPDSLRRLTMTQYRNTVRDLARWALGDADEADAALSAAELDKLPVDRREPTPQEPRGGYRRHDQALEQVHVEQTYRVAIALGRALTTGPRLGLIAGACAVNQNESHASENEACIADFIRSFGARALRRPLEAEDQSFYRAVYGSDSGVDAAAYADVIAAMLSSPQFFYFVEHGAEPIADKPGSYRLSAFELASRLSYHFWQTLPDDELWQAAQSGALLTPHVLAQQIDRLMADARTRETMAELFADWLGLDDLPALDAHASDPAFSAFAGDDLPGASLRQQAIDEALEMLAHYTWTEPAGIEALFTSERSFARGEELADLYGAPSWDGALPPPALPPSERRGLLTRAWFLASGTVNTRPIQRGVHVRRRLLCDELAPPPDSVAAMQLVSTSGISTRQAVEALTEQPDSVCASCHASLINPLGFAFEGFDALGRPRVEQATFDASGVHTGAHPIDTRTVPRVTPEDDRTSSGPSDLIALMLESGKLEACVARHYFRFTFGRREQLERDGCALQRLRARLAQGGRIRDMLAEAGLLPELQERRFEP